MAGYTALLHHLMNNFSEFVPKWPSCIIICCQHWYHLLENRQPLTSWINTVWMDAVTCRHTCTHSVLSGEKRSNKTCAPSRENLPAFCARSRRLWSGLICSGRVLCHNGSGGSRPVKHTTLREAGHYLRGCSEQLREGHCLHLRPWLKANMLPKRRLLDQ